MWLVQIIRQAHFQFLQNVMPGSHLNRLVTWSLLSNPLQHALFLTNPHALIGDGPAFGIAQRHAIGMPVAAALDFIDGRSIA